MSGGHFEYKKWQLIDAATEIELICRGENEFDYGFCPNTISELRNGAKIIRQAAIYLERIDYLLSCDDGEESFHCRLKEELLAPVPCDRDGENYD